MRILICCLSDFTQWNVSGGTITPNFALAPNGTQTATKYNIDGQYRVFLYTLNLSTSTEYTFSFYAKNISSTVATYRVYDVTNSANVLETSYLSELSTTDWSRIDVTFNTTSTGTSYNLYLMSGLGTGDILFWGAQLEQSSSAGAYRLTDGGATLNSTVIANPTIPTKDIFGNLVRDRLNSFNLDGSGYAEVADDADLDIGTGAFSFDGWAKYAFVDQGSSLNTIYTHLEDSANENTGFSLNTETGGKISAWFGSTGSSRELELSAGLSDGDWFYFALTRDVSGNVKLYASTDLQNPATNTQNPILTITNAANKRVGGDATSIPNNGFSRNYHNLISDVRLYDADLSATEVENNYNAGLSAHTNN